MTNVQDELREHRGQYGIDGGLGAIAGLVAMGTAGLFLTGLALNHARSHRRLLSSAELIGGLVLLQAIPSYLYSTRRGKFIVWAKLVHDLSLRGDEDVLDMGCGRGAVLTMLAKMVPRGRAVGLDLWRRRDQSGNSLEATWRNLEAEGVRGRCELHTADMRAMPFPDAVFDLIVSSLAIHNIKGRQGRIQAINEAVRVLKPGGRLLIADLMWTQAYAQRLRELGMENVLTHHLGRPEFFSVLHEWPFWYGTLGMAMRLVSATKPPCQRATQALGSHISSHSSLL